MDSFTDQTELAVDDLVRQVLARNPSLASMFEAWRAAGARPAQVSSLEDPMLSNMTAPGTWFSHDKAVPFSWRVEISQRLPYPGKLGLRGANAAAQADAAGFDVNETRLRLIETTRTTFYDYYLVDRELDINEDTIRVLRQFREVARTKFEAGTAPESDVLQAEVDLGDLGRRRDELRRARQVAQARLNTLMLRTPDAPLPPPPQDLTPRGTVRSPESLRALAVQLRPDLRAAVARIRAEQASVELACKDFYPDFEVMAGYDSFWSDERQRPFIGLNMNLPIQLRRRYAAVAEARARLRQRRADYDDRLQEAYNAIQDASARVQESERVIRLLRATVLPAAHQTVQAALAEYTTGQTSFLTLLDTQRRLLNQQENYHMAVAEYFRWVAELERRVGGPLAASPQEGREEPTGRRTAPAQESQHIPIAPSGT